MWWFISVSWKNQIRVQSCSWRIFRFLPGADEAEPEENKEVAVPFIVTAQMDSKPEKQVSTRPKCLLLNYFRKSQRVADFFPCSSWRVIMIPALSYQVEPHLNVGEQGLYGGQAFRKDEGGMVESCCELLAHRERQPFTVLPNWWGFLVSLSITALPAALSGDRSVCRAHRDISMS